MAKIVGKYVFVKEENFSGYFKAIGASDNLLKGVLEGSQQLEVKAVDNVYTITNGLGTRTFPLNRQIDERIPDGNVLRSIATLSGNKLTINSVGSDGKKGERVYEAIDGGLVLAFTNESIGSAKVFYKRAA